MIIREEQKSDFEAVAQLILNAFKDIPYSDHKEHLLVERLRSSNSYIPELSLVAEINGQIVGYILLTKISIINDDGDVFPSLALAPIAVLPEFQGKGIGGQLIQRAHEIASKMNYRSVVLLGHPDYYPRFGYKMAKTFGIRLPFYVPDENCMVIELQDSGLVNISGLVQYPNEFYG